MADGHHVLWSGGWDSTFRVARLVRAGGEIRPVYVHFPQRRSASMELETMARLTTWFAAWPGAGDHRIHPVEVVPQAEVEPPSWILDDYARILDRRYLGNQYTWLSALAHQRDVTLELCIHNDGTVRTALRDDVELDGEGRHRLVAEPSFAPFRIFAPFAFPLFDLTKVDMAAAASTEGFAEAMEMTWFCHQPVRGGVPCGRCNPCRYTREEGLGRRIPPEALTVKARRILRRARSRSGQVYASVVRDRPRRSASGPSGEGGPGGAGR